MFISKAESFWNAYFKTENWISHFESFLSQKPWKSLIGKKKFWQYSHQLQNQPSYNYFSFSATLIIPTLIFFLFVSLMHFLNLQFFVLNLTPFFPSFSSYLHIILHPFFFTRIFPSNSTTFYFINHLTFPRLRSGHYLLLWDLLSSPCNRSGRNKYQSFEWCSSASTWTNSSWRVPYRKLE